MKANFIILLITFMFTLTASAAPSRFQENVHYKVISNVATSKPMVTEYFSYFCPTCYRVEPIAKAIEKALPQGTKFNKSHVDFVGRASKDVQTSLAKAVAVAQALKIKHQFNDELFQHIHSKRQKITSEADIIDIMVKAGANEKKAKSLMKSFGVKNAARKMAKAQQDLTAKNAMTGVPMFVVNGKYTLLRENLKSQKEYDDLIAYLMAKK